MPGLVKICGVNSSEAGVAAARAGADLIGFVFFQKSPRYAPPEAAEIIVTEVKRACGDLGVDPPKFVGLFVDAGEQLLAEAAPFLTHFQFHGHEDADRCAEISTEFGVDVIKAFAISEAADFGAANAFEGAADMFLFDARPPLGADRPGGHGAPFDWRHIRDYQGTTPFFLAGGLDAANVGSAIAGAAGLEAFAGVDVSSGVEAQPGDKDLAKIAAFVAAARGAFRD